MNNTILMTVGTNANSYINRFIKIIGTGTKITFFQVTPKQIDLLIDGKKKDLFTSDITMKQFFRTLEAFGFIKKSIGYYEVLTNQIDKKYITDTIFSPSNDPKVLILRQTRIISLLLYINAIDKNDFLKKDFKGLKGSPKYENILKEVSFWEKETVKNTNELIDVLERTHKYEFTKN